VPEQEPNRRSPDGLRRFYLISLCRPFEFGSSVSGLPSTPERVSAHFCASWHMHYGTKQDAK
jgi:hypothetical protein